MPTTTNYGWTTPADTDLVKDGASAIRTLGTAIDTTVYNNAQAAIVKTIVDAKGDLIVATAADTVSRLAVGSTNGQILTVDSSTATGLAWGNPAAGMTLINTGGTTLSGASSVISSIPSTYKHLQLIIRGARPATDGANFSMRLNADTNNRYFYHLNNRATSEPVAATEIKLLEAADNGVDTSLITLDFYDYANTTTWKNGWGFAMANNSTTPANISYQLTGFAYNQTAAISSITLYPSTGNWTSGTAYLYGVS